MHWCHFSGYILRVGNIGTNFQFKADGKSTCDSEIDLSNMDDACKFSDEIFAGKFLGRTSPQKC
jgi:hypothetical protein